MTFLDSWGLLDKIFLTFAVVGSFIFGVKMVLLMIGVDHDGDVDGGGVDVHDGGIDVHDGDVSSAHDAHDGLADTDASFKLLTIQGITGFVMMFGWTGLAVSRGIGAGGFIAFPAAATVGGVAMYLTAKFVSLLIKMQSSGNVDIKNAVGMTGVVYLTIPAEGTGVVQVEVQERLREFEAVSQNKKSIKTGEQVRVVWVEGERLVVEKV